MRRAEVHGVAPAVNTGDDVRRARSFAAGIEQKVSCIRTRKAAVVVRLFRDVYRVFMARMRTEAQLVEEGRRRRHAREASCWLDLCLP